MVRSGYGSAFAAPTRSGWHRHHLIPRNVQRYPDLARFVATLPVMLGNFETNGMFLPALEKIAGAERLPLHRGPHRRYNEIVIAAVAAICEPSPLDDAARTWKSLLVRRLQEQLRLLLRTAANDIEVALGSRDPFGPSANLVALDVRTDALFAQAMCEASTRTQGTRPGARSAGHVR